MWWYVACFYVVLLVLVPASFIWGGWAERRVATLFFLAAALSIALRGIFLGTFFYGARYDIGTVVVDVALFAGLAIIAIRVPLWWTICEAALALTTVAAHLVKAIGVHLPWLAYTLMNSAGSYPALLLLAIAIAQSQQRVRPSGSLA